MIPSETSSTGVYRPDLLPDLPPGSGVAVVRLRSLGDSLLVTPALHQLKQWRPDLRIAFLVEPAFIPALEHNRDIDELIPVPRDTAGRLQSLLQLRRFQPQLSVSLHGSSTAAWLTQFSGAHWRATFFGLRHTWAHNLLTPPVEPPPGRRSLHTVEHVLSLFRHLGLPHAPAGPIQLAANPQAQARMRQSLAARGIAGGFAFIHANPRSFTMRWDSRKYIDLLTWLWREHGLATVMARHHSMTDEAFEESILAGLPDGAGTLITGTNVEDLIALIAESTLVLGSDGGPIHIAAGLQKPVVAIFSATDVDAWAPWQTSSRVVRNPWPCAPCPADHCYAHAQPECILSVQVEPVRQAVAALLHSVTAG